MSGGAGGRPAGPGGVAGGAEHDPGTGSGAGAARADGGLAVHLLPGRGEDHGRRPGRHPDRGLGRAAVRGRAPVELRRVRLPGAATAVRPERLRRDPARPVRVRREADGGEFHHRRQEQRPDRGGGQVGHRARRCGRTGRRWPSSREMRTMDLWYAHLSEDDLRAAIAKVAAAGHCARRTASRARTERARAARAPTTVAEPGRSTPSGRRAAQAGRQDAAQGAHPGQPAGPVQAR